MPCGAGHARSTGDGLAEYGASHNGVYSTISKLGSGVVRHGLAMPLFGALADLVAFGDIAEAADEAGLDGMFVWDHVLSPVEGQWPIADPWVALAVAATRSQRIKIGPMVTPLPCRRLINVSQATMSLDQLSGGRVILGLGLGSDGARELSAFGEPDDRAERAAKLTEGAELLTRLWSGKRVQHHTETWVVDDVQVHRLDGQRRRIPIWFGCAHGSLAPARRAAHYDGIYPIDTDVEGFKRIVEVVFQQRGSLEGFDLACSAHPSIDTAPFIEAGATWLLHAFWPGNTPDQVLRFISRSTQQ